MCGEDVFSALKVTTSVSLVLCKAIAIAVRSSFIYEGCVGFSRERRKRDRKSRGYLNYNMAPNMEENAHNNRHNKCTND